MGWANHRILAEDQRCDPRQKFENLLVPAGGLNALSEEELFDRNISWIDGRTYETVMTLSPDQPSWKTVWEYMPTRNRDE